MAKKYFDRYNKIFRVARIFATFCGADLFRHNYKMNIITWLVIAAINAYFACTVYTIYVGVVLRGDWKIILESLSLAGSAVQGYSKLIFGLRRREILYSIYKKLGKIYQEYQNDEDYAKKLKYRIDLITKILRILLTIYFVFTLLIITYPLIYGQLYDVKLLIMKFYLPGLDPASDLGYVLHNGVHAVLIFMGSFGNFAGDMFIFIIIIHIPLLKDILQIKCKKLSKVLLRKKHSKKTLPLLKDIIIAHQGYNIYVQDVDNSYYGVIFVQIITSVFCICCTLFSILTRSWPAAFAYLIYSVGMLYAYCGLGNLVEVSNDEVINIIYEDILWYELSVPEQKSVLLMLRKSQMPTTLTVGHIMPLSMSTALQLTKAIYSYMMVLVNFLETYDT